MFRHAPLNLLDRDRLPRLLPAECPLANARRFLRQFLAAERCKGSDAHERALQSDARLCGYGGEELKNVIAQFDLHGVRFFRRMARRVSMSGG
jgi:hypothetical protein